MTIATPVVKIIIAAMMASFTIHCYCFGGARRRAYYGGWRIMKGAARRASYPLVNPPCLTVRF